MKTPLKFAEFTDLGLDEFKRFLKDADETNQLPLVNRLNDPSIAKIISFNNSLANFT